MMGEISSTFESFFSSPPHPPPLERTTNAPSSSQIIATRVAALTTRTFSSSRHKNGCAKACCSSSRMMVRRILPMPFQKHPTASSTATILTASWNTMTTHMLSMWSYAPTPMTKLSFRLIILVNSCPFLHSLHYFIL
jgi:hypothetical protein